MTPTRHNTKEEIGSALVLPYAELNQLLAKHISEDIGTVTAEDVIRQILDAKTIEEILGSSILHMEDMSDGDVFVLHGYKIQPSSFGGNAPQYYAVMDIEYEDERTVCTAGSGNILAQLLKLEDAGAFPVTAALSKRITKDGNNVYRLRRPPTHS